MVAPCFENPTNFPSQSQSNLLGGVGDQLTDEALEGLVGLLLEPSVAWVPGGGPGGVALVKINSSYS